LFTASPRRTYRLDVVRRISRTCRDRSRNYRVFRALPSSEPDPYPHPYPPPSLPPCRTRSGRRGNSSLDPRSPRNLTPSL